MPSNSILHHHRDNISSIFLTTALAMLLYCIPAGMGRALGTINGVYYRAQDRKALEHLFLPVAFAVILGALFGTRGVLAALAVSRIFIIVSSFLINCVRCHGVPKAWKDIMLLPKEFGGTESDNIYAEIRTIEDVVRESERTYDFCLERFEDKRLATMTALFVEEMAGNVVRHAEKTDADDVYVNYRLFANHGRVCINIMDLGDRFDPAAFYEMYHDDSPGRHVGIRIVMNMAKDVLYFNTFRSNNLTIYLEADSEE